MASRQVVRAQTGPQLWQLSLAPRGTAVDLLLVGASRMERASGRRVQQAGRSTGDRDQRLRGVPGYIRDAAQQAPGVRHLRVDQNLLGGAQLDAPAAVHDEHL